MYVYVLIFLYLLLMFLIVNNRKIKNEGWLTVLTFLILFFIAGFRHYSVGSDTMTYKAIFESKMNLPSLSEYFSSRFELGFLYLNDFIYNYISTDYSIYLAIYSFLTLIITFYVLKKESNNFYLSLIIYFGFGIYTWTMTNIRGSLAIAFIFLAYYFIKRNKNIKALISILLASAFHITALVFLIVYLFKKIRIEKKGLLIITGITAVGYIGARSLIESLLEFFVKYESYIQTDNYIDNAKLSTILTVVIILLVFLFGEYVFMSVTLNKSENFLRNIMILGLVTSVIAVQISSLGRITAYFSNFIILYIPLIISKMKTNDYIKESRKILILFFIIILFGCRFFVILILKPEWNILIPYENTLIDFFSGSLLR